MADEYYNNKIVTTDGDVLMDLTQDTATPETVLEGETFHLRSGAPATGTYRPSDEIEARLRATVGHSSKNLLEITAHASTSYEVTFTPDRINGTILATGQCNPPATNRAQYDYGGGLKPIPDSFRQELILKDDGLIGGTQSAIAFYDDSGTYISGVVCDKTTKSKTVTIPSNATKYKTFVRKLASAGDVDVTFKPMLREASISDGSFEPYVTPTDEAKQDKPVMLYDAGETSVGVHSVTGLSNLTQYSELHITLFAPLSGDEPDTGYTHTIVFPFIFPNNPANQAALFDCWITIIESGSEIRRRTGLYVTATNTSIELQGELDEQTGYLINIPSNHYIYIKRIVGIP